MNILVLGNGFDLAHGLPTKYTDFLDFLKVIKQVINIKDPHDVKIHWEGIDVRIKEKINHDMRNLSSFEKKWKELVDNNVWIDYFLQCDMHGNENWIDFESEISKVIKILDKDIDQYRGKDNLYSVVEKISHPFFATYFLDDIDNRTQERDIEGCKLCANMPVGGQSTFLEEFRKEHPVESLNGKITYKNLITKLEQDLNRLTYALEIYLTENIEKVEVVKKFGEIGNLDIDHVLSFNYTNTYEKVYGGIKKFNYDYIHGKADIRNSIELNNMVLGIDEYLQDDRKDIDTDFIVFKKYYQRIYKQTGCKYRKWVDGIKMDYLHFLKTHERAERIENKYTNSELKAGLNRQASFAIRNEKCKIHNLYIFGHSLDATDKDILRDLILNDNVHTTIFYHSKEELGRKIANLVKVIGQDELIRRTGGSTRTIKFELQQDMVPIKE